MHRLKLLPVLVPVSRNQSDCARNCRGYRVRTFIHRIPEWNGSPIGIRANPACAASSTLGLLRRLRAMHGEVHRLGRDLNVFGL